VRIPFMADMTASLDGGPGYDEACLVSPFLPRYPGRVPSWFAVTADGTARRVGGLGLVIGRGPTCDLVIDEPEVSRRHLLLQFGVRGQLDIVPFPGARTSLNGVALEAPRAASAGDALTFPGGTTISLIQDGAVATPNARAWLLDVGGRRIGLRGDDLELGGGEDDVVIDGWPASAARLTWRGDSPVIEAIVAGLRCNDAPLDPGAPSALNESDRLAFGERAVTIVTDAREPEPTLRDLGRIRTISLEMLPSGGMFTLTTETAAHRVLLSERRFALAMVLLVPPPPLRAGELIPDEIVYAAVWPRNASVDRGDLNQLVFRLRADLRAAGCGSSTLVDRFAKGGATRFVVDASTTITTST
jgi:hypothetical protein